MSASERDPSASRIATSTVSLSARTVAPQPGATVTDLSAAKKKKKPAQPKEEYLKAAPGTGPSGPQTKY